MGSVLQGRILLGPEGIPVRRVDVPAANGVIHMLEGILLPPTILPILPKHCDEEQHQTVLGSCVDCQALNTSVCPPNSVKMVSTPARPSEMDPFCQTLKHTQVAVGSRSREGWTTPRGSACPSPALGGRMGSGLPGKGRSSILSADWPCVARPRISSPRSAFISTTQMGSTF